MAYSLPHYTDILCMKQVYLAAKVNQWKNYLIKSLHEHFPCATPYRKLNQ